jgi:hypothetical protein
MFSQMRRPEVTAAVRAVVQRAPKPPVRRPNLPARQPADAGTRLQRRVEGSPEAAPPAGASARSERADLGGAAPSVKGSTSAPEAVDEALRSGDARPLDPRSRAYFEPRLGQDLSGVRVHLGSAADASTRAVGAVAYTVGRDIVFRASAFAPETTAGKKLLAHELAHVAQQPAGAAPASTTGELTVAGAHDPAEREADVFAEAAMRSDAESLPARPASPVPGHAPAVLHRTAVPNTQPDAQEQSGTFPKGTFSDGLEEVPSEPVSGPEGGPGMGGPAALLVWLGIQLITPRSTAQAWQDEINPFTQQPYASEQEYNITRKRLMDGEQPYRGGSPPRPPCSGLGMLETLICCRNYAQKREGGEKAFRECLKYLGYDVDTEGSE